jgi:uncharacterized protein (TIGR02453 family)
VFAGFSPEATRFLAELADNNERAWFLENKARYEADVVAPFRALLASVMAGLAARDIPLGGDPAKAIFRIHRDVRFSKDKRPYKTHAGAVLARDGGKSPDGGIVYIHVDPTGSFLAAGFYMPEPAKLGAIREAIFVEPQRFQSVLDELAKAGLELSAEESLTRLPRGYEEAAGAPAERLLKLKSFLIRKPVPDALLTSADLTGEVVSFAEAALPLLRFGWQALTTVDPADLKRRK